ncbi:MAG: transglutaminase domain-containing protein [Chitinophagaceae bacterium]
MKWLLLMVMMWSVQAGLAQERRINFADADRHAQAVPFSTPDTLAQQLTSPFSSDLQKVRTIFRWITHNIAYNVAVYPRVQRVRGFKNTYIQDYDSVVESKGLDERVAYSVLRNKVALCNGYARLFKTLCDYAGIPSEIVTGYARSNMGSRKFKSNHTWNAVYIDSAWHLLDATWASGFITYGHDEFIRQFNEEYFLAAPEQMIRSHYPEHPRRTLQADPPTLAEYRQAPFKPTAFINYTIQAYQPSGGIVEAAVGDTLLFVLQSSDVAKDRTIAAENYYDSLTLAGNGPLAFLQPAENRISATTTYTYVVPSAAVSWINLLYNNDVVLRYRLNVKARKEDSVELR